MKKLSQRIYSFFTLPFFTAQRTVFIVWTGLAIFTVFRQYFKSGYNNYLIFKYMFVHAWEGVTMYGTYPDQYFDQTHYGPVFSIFIMPFAVLPDLFGLLLFQLLNCWIVFYSVSRLRIKNWQIIGILWLVTNEMYSAFVNTQFNPMTGALFILSFVLIERKKDFWASLPILFGAFVKLYGIIGLIFFFFAKDKKKYILGCLCWSVVLFIAPMLISSPEYVIQSYGEWITRLTVKNSINYNGLLTDNSVMGLVRHVSGYLELSNLPFLAAGAVLFLLPYIHKTNFDDHRFRLFGLASALMLPVLFSTGSESSTYIIAFLGIAIWYVNHDRPFTKMQIFLIVFALLLTSFSTTDLVPKAGKLFIREYKLKALPALIIWLTVIYEMFTLKKQSLRSKNEKE